MTGVQHFEAAMNRHERNLIGRLTSPPDIQAFLDGIAYKAKTSYQSPLGVLRTREANCFDGALFAAAALRRMGQAPLILHMRAADDDDHIIALYRRNGCVGAVAKSNFVGLRYRDPIYRNVRELLLSYFELYFNRKGKKSLRGYTGPLNLSAFDRISWMTRDDSIEAISQRLDSLKQYPLIPAPLVRLLSPVDRRTYRANLLGATMRAVHRRKRGQ